MPVARWALVLYRYIIYPTNNKRCFMNYKQSWLTALVITLLSLFSQSLNWIAFEKIGYDEKFTLITPLILCFMYHLVQLDLGKKSGISRIFFFIFSCAAPFALGLILTIILVLTNFDISTFNPDVDYAGTVPEVTATYAGRFMVTSLYIAVFALIDIPILKHIDTKRNLK